MWRRRRGREEGGTYEGLRRQVLELDPADIGAPIYTELPNVWGGLMEMGLGEEVATIVSLTDGTTSLYTSTGGGMIGGGEHESVAKRTLTFLLVLERCLDSTRPEGEPELPGAGQVGLHALCYDGPRGGVFAQDELASGDHPLSPAYSAGHDVITALRELEEAMPPPPE